MAEIAVKLRSYCSLVLLFRLAGGISFLLRLGMSFVELLATHFKRLPMTDTIIILLGLIGVSAVCAVGGRALNREIRETQELLAGQQNCQGEG
jgi:hypothetical protein